MYQVRNYCIQLQRTMVNSGVSQGGSSSKHRSLSAEELVIKQYKTTEIIIDINQQCDTEVLIQYD